ncbi:MAG: hypothetical protein AB1714_31875 [Acidobacteriota bacterium]
MPSSDRSRLLVACLFVVWNTNMPAVPCSAQDNLDGQKVVFSASQKMFVNAPRSLTARRPANVILKDVNTFRERYTVKLQQQDYHTAAVPDALAGLLVGVKTQPTSGALALAAARRTCPPDFKNIIQLEKSYEAFFKQRENFDRATKCSPAAQVAIDSIRDAIRIGQTNVEIRGKVVDKLLDPLGKSVDCESGNCASIEDALGVLRKAIEDKTDTTSMREDKTRNAAKDVVLHYDCSNQFISKAFADLEKQRDSWQQTFDAFVCESPNPQDPVRLKAAGAVNDIVRTLFNEASGTHSQLTELNRVLQNLLITFMNPDAVPAQIVKTVSTITGDRAEVVVQVDQLPSGILLVDPSDPKKPINSLIADSSAGSETFSLTLPVYWRLVADFSAGLTVTSLKQPSYYRDNAGIVRQGPTDRWNLGAAVLGQFYFTTPWHVSAGPTVGVMVADPARYLLGLSVIAGSRLRLSYSFGLAYGKINELSNGDHVGEPAAGATVSTSLVTRKGHFNSVTVSYSF